MTDMMVHLDSVLRDSGLGTESLRSPLGTTTAGQAETLPEAEPLWITGGRWPLFAWIHRPAGSPITRPFDRPARAGGGGVAVLCPPLLGEHGAGYHLYRRLGNALAAGGVMALRFDYEGTGDSGGPSAGPGRVSAWLDSAGRVIRMARQWGCGPLALVGVRSGALIAAAAAAARDDIDALVLWDPWMGGRPFIRRQQALYSMSFSTPASSEDIEVPGFTLDAGTAADLSTLRLAARVCVRRGLVLLRPGRELTPISLVGAGAMPGAVTEVKATEPGEQEALFDVDPLLRRLPEASIKRAVGWLQRTILEAEDTEPHGSDQDGGQPERQTLATTPVSRFRSQEPASGATLIPICSQAVAVTVTSCGIGTVYEQPLRLGPHRLFAIETRPRSAPGGSPVVIFLSSGADSHVGPSRMWVTLARRWAAEGARCLRVDLSGWGDSEPWSGRTPMVIRPPEAFDDVDEVVSAAAGSAREVVLVGLCSGAYQALESALELSPLAVLAVNPLLRFTPPEMVEGKGVSNRRQICDPRRPWAKALVQLPGPLRAAVLAARYAARDAARLMGSIASSGTWLDRLETAGVHVYCVCGEGELRQLPRSLPSPTKAARGATGADPARIELVPGLDHALLDTAQRHDVMERLSEELRRIVSGMQR